MATVNGLASKKKKQTKQCGVPHSILRKRSTISIRTICGMVTHTHGECGMPLTILRKRGNDSMSISCRTVTPHSDQSKRPPRWLNSHPNQKTTKMAMYINGFYESAIKSMNSSSGACTKL